MSKENRFKKNSNTRKKFKNVVVLKNVAALLIYDEIAQWKQNLFNKP